MQTIIKGAGSVAKIKEALATIGSQKFLLVCDSAFDFSAANKVFYNSNLCFARFSDFTPNPIYEDVVKGVEFFKAENCDCIVAVGGGSAIDVAKCIKLFSNLPNCKNYLTGNFTDSGVPLIAIPTTAGTGSESTKFAVIYLGDIKQSVTHQSIIPNVAILDPNLLKTLPLYQKKCTLLDALCQGIESWWSVNSTAESRCYSQKAIRLIVENYRAYIFENCPAAAEKIMEGANLAGRAINIAETTAPHAISYKITSLFSLPHGKAVAVVLPYVWEYMLKNTANCKDIRGSEYLANVFNEIAHALGEKSPEMGIKFFRKILKELEIEPPQISLENLEIICNSVNPTRLKNNPVALSHSAIKFICKQIGAD